MKRTNTNLLLKNIFDKKPGNEAIYDCLKEVYDLRFYHYGSHFKYHFENPKAIPYKSRLKKAFYDFVIGAFVFLFQNRKQKNQPTVLSTVYFGADLFLKNKYPLNISRPPWMYNSWRCNIYDWNLFKKSNYFKRKFKNANFTDLVSDEFIGEIEAYKKELKAFVKQHNIVAFFVAQDTGFFEKLAISVFKEMKLPTFAFVHGLQFWINKHDFSRTDYLVVWGELSKKDFVMNGFEESKVLVSGHPVYKADTRSKLRFELDSILVLANSLNGITPSEDYVLTDRSNCIYYLNLIQESLQKFGVKSVRLRPHPSENSEWYKQNLDPAFFQIDTDPLGPSLNKTSLVIGPTSTVFLEALVHGVNYLVFNPENQYGKGLNGLHIPSLFNGNNNKVPVAKTPEELERLLSAKKCVDLTILKELMAENFSLDEVYKRLQPPVNQNVLKTLISSSAIS